MFIQRARGRERRSKRENITHFASYVTFQPAFHTPNRYKYFNSRTHTRMYTCIYVYVYTHTHAYVYIYIYIYVYVYTYMYIYTYFQTKAWGFYACSKSRASSNLHALSNLHACSASGSP